VTEAGASPSSARGAPAGTPAWRGVLQSPWTKVVFAAAVIAVLVAFNRIDPRSFYRLRDTWAWLLLALVLMLPTYGLVSYRFWRVLRNQGIAVTRREAVRWTMIGSFFDIAMPSNSGGDVIKAGYVIRHVGAGQRTTAVMAVAFDRVLGLLGLFLLAAVTSLAGWETVRLMPRSVQLVAVLVGVSFGSLAFLQIMGSGRLAGHERVRKWIETLPGGARLNSVIRSFALLRRKPADLAAVLALSVLNHMLWCASLLCITVAFGQAVQPLQGFTVFPLAIFCNVFGFAGGFGVGTAAFDLIFAKLLTIHGGAAIGLTFQTLSAFSRLAGLPFYLGSGPRARR